MRQDLSRFIPREERERIDGLYVPNYRVDITFFDVDGNELGVSSEYFRLRKNAEIFMKRVRAEHRRGKINSIIEIVKLKSNKVVRKMGKRK